MTISTHPEGYLRVYVGRRHPLADRAGYVYLHRLILAAEGRLAPVTHHRNGRKASNGTRNLEGTTRSEHSRAHALGQARGKDGRFTNGRA